MLERISRFVVWNLNQQKITCNKRNCSTLCVLHQKLNKTWLHFNSNREKVHNYFPTQMLPPKRKATSQIIIQIQISKSNQHTFPSSLPHLTCNVIIFKECELILVQFLIQIKSQMHIRMCKMFKKEKLHLKESDLF